MTRKREELTLRIQKLQKAIRKKYKQFKYGVVESEEKLEKQFKPLISELRKKTPEIKSEVKIEPKEEEKKEEKEEEEDMDETYFEPKAISSFARPTFFEDESTPQSTSRFINDTFTNELTIEYMQKMIGPESRNLDHMFGPRYEGDTLMVGNKLLQFDDDGTIIVGDTKYAPTKGLYELLFKTTPNKEMYTKKDLENYRDILERSNAHKKDYMSGGRVNRNNSRKYKNIIEPLYPKIGRGWKIAKQKDLVRWDDPNELVDRLRHLIVSTETGNRGHVNEIINIVEELKEAKYISGRGNGRFRALLK